MVLFIDMNAFFASVEQQDAPSLRARPVGVTPLKTDKTCCIAVSYEARAHGVRTGTPVWEAKRLCPEIALRPARVSRYIECHEQIKAAIDRHVPIEAVCSVDEFRCRLTGWQADLGTAIRIAGDVRHSIRADVGESLRCSIGIAPNAMLGKLASGMQKPDGLTVIRTRDLPGILLDLELTDFPGISDRMALRLRSQGITTTQGLCSASRKQLRAVWGGVIGEDWWHWLRGEEAGRAHGPRRSFGNQHVLAPELRTPEGSRAVAVRLLHKAAARLRFENAMARQLSLQVSGEPRPDGHRDSVALSCRFTPTAETGDLMHWLTKLWDSRPGIVAKRITVVLSDLVPVDDAGESLFDSENARGRLGKAMDAINQKMGHASVYYGAMHHAKDAAPRRIAFHSIPEMALADTEV